MPKDVFHCPARGKRFMFTGLIEGVCRLAARELRGGDARLRIAVGSLPFENVVLGESISVNGACLTVMAFDDAHFDVDASTETLALTTLGELPVGAAENLERAMRPDDRLGGPLASGPDDRGGRVRGAREHARAGERRAGKAGGSA